MMTSFGGRTSCPHLLELVVLKDNDDVGSSSDRDRRWREAAAVSGDVGGLRSVGSEGDGPAVEALARVDPSIPYASQSPVSVL